MDNDADVKEGLQDFNDNGTSTNLQIIPEDWKPAKHLEGESSCCSDKTILALKVIV